MKKFLNKHSVFVLLFPYALLFVLFIILPTVAAIALSFTDFNTIQFPDFVGAKNYISLFTNDSVFMQKVLPNTVVYAVFTGIGGYILSFLLAWMLAQLTRPVRTFLTIIIYAPSMTGGVMLATIWTVIFNGDKSGYLNALLLKLGFIEQPVAWAQSDKYLLPIMIIVTLWSSMGIGFLAMLSGITNGNTELYEAGYIDGIKNRFQELFMITIPSMKPQMMFAAVMQIAASFAIGNVGKILCGFPSTNYSVHTIVNHIEDYGRVRYEMGYAAAISFMLTVVMILTRNVITKLLKPDE